MSKLGVISDIHGDIGALERAWCLLEGMGVSRVVCAGDVVGYGPEPDRVARFLDQRGIATARGNHDGWAVARPPGQPDRFGGTAPDDRTRAYLRTLPPCLMLSVAGRFVAVTHTAPDDGAVRDQPSPECLRAIKGYLDLLGARVLVIGHTHRPLWFRTETGLVVNPGSLVVEPVVRSSRTFAVVDPEALTVTFHELPTGRLIEVPPALE